MGLTASDKGGSDFELTPEGIYTARCYRIIDLGTQKGAEIFGSKDQHKVMISWELIGADDPKMQEGENKGKPFSIHKRYTVSLGEKASLRQDLESWRGRKFTSEELRGFDLSKVLGQYCTIQIVHSEDGKYANVQTIMAHKGTKPEPVNPNLIFDIDKPDMQIFETLSDNIKGTIMQAPEWNKKQSATKEPVQEKLDTVYPVDEEEPINIDDIPF
jgi:hypothetical protein